MGSNNSSLSKSMFHNIRCASFLHAFHSVSLTNDWPYCGIKTWYSNIWPINQMASENKQTSERTRRVEEMWEDVERKLIYNSPASIWNLRQTHTLTLMLTLAQTLAHSELENLRWDWRQRTFEMHTPKDRHTSSRASLVITWPLFQV